MSEERYFFIDNLLDSENIDKILNINEDRFVAGKVGNRINLKQKNRKDHYLSCEKLKNVDNIIFPTIYEKIKQNCNLQMKFREGWKIGKYNGEDGGFYNLHTDDARETKYRQKSIVIGLTDPNEYEGGILHFPQLKKQFKLGKGQAIIFDSSLLHGVKPVTDGIRNVLVSFLFDENNSLLKKKMLNSKSNAALNRYKPILSQKLFDYNLPQDSVYVSGDIDYSDFKKKPWSDTDDFFYDVNDTNDNETLIVSFAGMGYKDSLPTFNFYNFLKQFPNVDKLFLRDTGPPDSTVWTCRYYLMGFRHNTHNIETSIEFIRKLVNKKKYKKIIGIGCSAGGYAATLYGTILNFDKIIVFNPQTCISTDKKEEIDDDMIVPRGCKFLSNRKFDDEFYQKCLDLKNFFPNKVPTDIHVSSSANRGLDYKHVQRLESFENVTVTTYKTNNHLLALKLRDDGTLKEIIQENI